MMTADVVRISFHKNAEIDRMELKLTALCWRYRVLYDIEETENRREHQATGFIVYLAGAPPIYLSTEADLDDLINKAA